MEDLAKQAELLQSDIKKAMDQLGVESLQTQLQGLVAESRKSDFWSDTSKAQTTMKQISKLESRIRPWQELSRQIADAKELADMGDEQMKSELAEQIDRAGREFDTLKDSLKLNGEYDDHDAIVSIYAGAGGTDAQDWTQILFRMYSRFFEKNRWKTKVVDDSAGDEAGLKSITLEVEGDFAYGKLKSEHGVHRLVRLSPFNADNLRQTSFAKVEVMPAISAPEELEIDDKDLKVDVYRSGGHGGQSVNTTDSAVRVTHIPTGITVAIQNERSQLQNKATAMKIIRSRLAQMQLEQHKVQLSELKGTNQSAEWGNQIRSYVLHPYKQVKDLRSRYETSDPDAVLDGDLEPLINAYLEHHLASEA